MTECPSISNKYIDYNSYNCLNYRFPNCIMTEDGLKYLKDSENSMKQKIPNFTPRKDFLEWIIKHLICNRVFMHVNTNRACKYINFWLNKKVKDFNFYEYHSNFENYKEFVKTFYTVVKGDYNSYKYCTDNIDILNNDEYNKMNMLYTLYNEYDELKKIHELVYEDRKTCKIIQNITNVANDVARSYKNDDEFINVLRDLRDKIKNGKEKYQTLCESDLKQLDTMVTEKAFPPRKPDPPPPKEISHSTDSLEQTTHEALAQHVSGNGIRNEPEPNVDLQGSARRVQLSSGEHFTKVSHERSLPEAQHPIGSSLGVSHHSSSYHAGELHEELFKSAPLPGEQYERSRDAYPTSVYTGYNPVDERITTEGVITPTDGTQSYLENIRGTITGVLGSVDPVPVVGVSGGMGALFLLFRYTPVGAFFRGGRGRARRIPSGFNGQFLGGFPGYEDYDVGHIGYGPMNPLAE
ncbi:PIR protein [Plasmodium vivax]|nr:PIR protein [Plasmodium vivax]